MLDCMLDNWAILYQYSYTLYWSKDNTRAVEDDVRICTHSFLESRSAQKDAYGHIHGEYLVINNINIRQRILL